MSRAQLAAAVTAGSGEDVTGDIVYAWERGQPPTTTAQLAALQRTMRRTGLTDGHVRGFQTTVLAACGAWRYEGLFADDTPDNGDTEAVAVEAYALQRDTPGTLSLVDLTILAHDLEEAVRRDWETSTPPARERSRQVALVHARAALAGLLASDQLRWVPAATRIWDENARFLEGHFGAAGLGGSLTPIGQRIAATWFRAHAELSGAAARELLDLSRAAVARGEKREAARAAIKAAHVLGEAGAGAYASLRRETHRHLRVAMDSDGDMAIHVGHLDLAWAALGDGHVTEAASLLDAYERWCHAAWSSDAWWRETRWWTLAERGAYREAAEFLSGADCPPDAGSPLWRLSDMVARGRRVTCADHCREMRRETVRNGLAGTGVPPAPAPRAGWRTRGRRA
jgi:hypothetical protein